MKVQVQERASSTAKSDQLCSVSYREPLLLITIIVISVVVFGIGLGWAITGSTDMGTSSLTEDKLDDNNNSSLDNSKNQTTDPSDTMTIQADFIAHLMNDIEALSARVIAAENKATAAETRSDAAEIDAAAAYSKADAAQVEATAAKHEAEVARVEARAANGTATAAGSDASSAKSDATAAKDESLNASNLAHEAITKANSLLAEFDAQDNIFSKSSSTYVRWGRTTCNGNSTYLVYKGYAGGSWYASGSGSNYVCLTEEPTWEYDSLGNGPDYGRIYGVEYQVSNDWPLKTDNVYPDVVYQHDAPCAVCETIGRGSVLMIPGTHVCPPGWTEEYAGYLMSNHHAHAGTEYVCVDGIPEAVPGGNANTDGALFYYVRAFCGALPCPPYVNNREVTCIVCTK